MAIRFYKPTSPGRRGMSTQDFGEITKSVPEKSLLEHKTAKAGRNNYGRLTTRIRSQGHKTRYRKGYILAPARLAVGDQVIAANSADIKPGNCLPLRCIPGGTDIHAADLRAT